LLASFLIVGAQQAQTVQEPEYFGPPHYLDPASGALSPLEKQGAVIKMRMKALGCGGAEGAYEVKGRKSPIRLADDQKIEFVVRVASPQVDPSSVIQLVSLKATSSKRELVAMKAPLLGDMTVSYTRPYSYRSAGLVGQTLRRTREKPSSNTPPKTEPAKEEILTNDSIIQLLKAGL